MKLGNLSQLMCLLASSMAGGNLFGASPTFTPCECASQIENWNFSAEASRLLKEIRLNSAKLTGHAETLKSYPHSGISRESHASQLTSVKEHINSIGDRLERLLAIRHLALPWQQQAIDSIQPLAANVATHTTAAIEHLNQNPNHLWTPVYKEHLKSLAERASEMKRAVNLHLELADTQQKADELRNKVAVIGS